MWCPNLVSFHVFIQLILKIQFLQARILYEIRGDGDAIDYFEIDAVTGDLTVKASLANDTSKVLSYRVRLFNLLSFLGG